MATATDTVTGSVPSAESPRRRPAKAWASRALLLPLAVAAALGAGEAHAWRITPSVRFTETWSDNAGLFPPGLEESGWITGVAPAVRVDHRGSRATVFADFSVHRLWYSNQPRLDRTQRFLSAFGTLEAVDKWLFLDARADISQQNRTPFGPAVVPDEPSAVANRIETRTYELAPYIRGSLGTFADYQARYSVSETSTNESAFGDSRTNRFLGRMRNPSPSARIGWALDADALTVDNDFTGTREDSRVRASLILGIDPFHFSVNGGVERTDFEADRLETTGTHGLGFEWSPGPRTQLAAIWEKRFFGNAHDVLFTHRTARTSWRLSSFKDASVISSTSTRATIADLMSDLLAASIRDPVARAEAVRRRLYESGVGGGSALSSGFLASRPFINHNQEAAFILTWPRTTFTLSLTRREQEAFGDGPIVLADGTTIASHVRSRGAHASLGHRLTPLTSLAVSATNLRTEGRDEAAERTRQRHFSIYLNTQLGPRTSASLGVRRTDFDSTRAQSSYKENAIIGTFSIRL